MEGGGSQSLQGKGVGISHRQQNIKTADKLLIREGEGEDHKSVTKPYGGSDKCYRDRVKIVQLSPPPLLTQAINSVPSPSSLMHLDRIDLQRLNFFLIECLTCRILLSEESYAQVIMRFRELGRLEEDVVSTFRRWIPKRKRTLEKLEELATKLHEQHIKVSKSTIAGASASTVGGILAIAGLIAAPFTFGAGLVVSLVGAGIGGAGGLVMSVSKVIEITLAKLGLKEVQGAIDEDKEACTQLQEKLGNLERFISNLREIESNGFEFLHQLVEREFTTSTEEKIDISARFFRAFSSAASVGAGAFAAAGAFARAGGLAGVRVANLAGGIVGAVLLPLDVYMLVKSSLEVHRGSTTQAVNDIRKLISELECPEEEDMQKMVRRFIAEKLIEIFNDGDSNEV